MTQENESLKEKIKKEVMYDEMLLGERTDIVTLNIVDEAIDLAIQKTVEEIFSRIENSDCIHKGKKIGEVGDIVIICRYCLGEIKKELGK